MSRSLLRILGLSFGLAVTVGNSIGAGILRTPGDVATWLPSPWAFVGVWIVGAAYALLGVNALAELGTMLPRSGAQYVYARHAFGDYAGFVVGWIDWISTAASVAAIAIVIGESLSALVRHDAALAAPLAMAVVVVFALLLWRGTRLGDRAQQVTSLVKAVVLLALIAACFLFAGRAHVAVAAPAGVAPHASGAWSGTALMAWVLAAQAVIYSYDGWTGPLYFAEELDDPARQIPRSMFGGLLCVGLIYVLTNVAFMRVVPPSALAGSTLAAAAVAQTLFGAAGETVVRLVVVLALPSAVNACLLMASRVLFAVSRDGLAPGAARAVNAGGTPSMALFLSAGVALLFLATGTFQTVIAIAAFFFVANYSLSFLAVFVLRHREPGAARPWRALGHPWSTGLVLAGSLGFLGGAIVQDRKNSLYALGLLVVSYPAYRVVKGRRAPLAAAVEGSE